MLGVVDFFFPLDSKSECEIWREMLLRLSGNAMVNGVLLLSVECWAETIPWGAASHLGPKLSPNPVSLPLTGLNPAGNANMFCHIALRPHSVSQLSIPEVWQQPVQARVHGRSARSIGGVGFQGEVQQETRHWGIRSRTRQIPLSLLCLKSGFDLQLFPSFSWRPARAWSCWSSPR